MSSSSSSFSSSSSASSSAAGAGAGGHRAIKAPRLTGNVAFDRGAQDDLAGVVCRLVTGYVGEGGTADLRYRVHHEYIGEHFVLRKYWLDSMGGPRIGHYEIRELDVIADLPAGADAAATLRHSEAVAERAKSGWGRLLKGVALRENEWVRTRDTFAATRENSALLAQWFLSHVLANKEYEHYRSEDMSIELRLFNLPSTYLSLAGELRKDILERIVRIWDTAVIPCGTI